MAGAQIVPNNRPLDRKEKREECVLCVRAQNQSLKVCAHTEKGLCACRKKGDACMPLPPIHLPPWLSTVTFCIQSMACRHEDDNYQEEAIAAVYVGFC